MSKKIVLSLLILFILPFIVLAKNCNPNALKIEKIVIAEKSESVEELSNPIIDNNAINVDLEMAEVGDYIKYKIEITNPTEEDYELSKTDIQSEYIDYNFDFDKNIIKSNETKEITLIAQYKREIPKESYEAGVFRENKEVIISLTEDKKIIDIIDNPGTGYLEIIIILLITILATGLTLLSIKSKAKKVLLILAAIIIPLSVSAICTSEININSNIVIKKPHTCISFSDDSWDDIKYNVSTNYTDCYHVGDTKEIDVTGFGKQIVRISNMSTPEICNSEGFSQTACGFVIEFRDIVTKMMFNSSGYSSGGWEQSEARNYLNGEFITLLPEDLQKIIVETYTVSGHEGNVLNNYETYDKLYLLATAELWKKVGTNDIAYDSADTLTRQFDYYESIPVTSTNYRGADKKYNGTGTNWWLRTVHKTSNNYIGNVQRGATNAYHGHASLVYGISPAFKIN